MISVLPLPVAIQNASFFRSASLNFASLASPAVFDALRSATKPFSELQQLPPTIEVGVEENLRVEHRQVLEVPQRDRLRPTRVHRFQMLADVVVVAGQVGGRNLYLVPARHRAGGNT
ncbi:MAG: hypothetical protein U5N86_12160 [Planctomycetota bacterium]|nr:hypothetical protein [Planctomycetota bacterium]